MRWHSLCAWILVLLEMMQARHFCLAYSVLILCFAAGIAILANYLNYLKRNAYVARGRHGEGMNHEYSCHRDDTGKKLRSLEKKSRSLEKKIRPWKRNLGSSGPVVLWSCGPLVLWSSGPVVLWSCGPLVLWSCGAVSSGPVVLWSCGSGAVVVSCSGPLVPWVPGQGVKRNM